MKPKDAADLSPEDEEKRGLADSEHMWFMAEFERLQKDDHYDINEYMERFDEHLGTGQQVREHIELSPKFITKLGKDVSYGVGMTLMLYQTHLVLTGA